MAFDGIVTKAITNEISNLSGARVDKIFEPNKNTVVLGLYLNGKNYAINMCIDAQNCRIHLTTKTKPNPDIAPNFCMLLRKNLIGLRFKNASTIDLDRIIILEFEGFDEFDNFISKKLIVELMGKHSNIILLNDSNIIIDSLRHIKEKDDVFRDILPHVKYSFPHCTKKNFLDFIDFDDFYNYLSTNSNNNFDSMKLSEFSSFFANTFNGFSKSFINNTLIKLNILHINKENLSLFFNYLNNIINSIGTDKLLFEKIFIDNILKDYFLTISEITQNQFALSFFIDEYYYAKETDETFKTHRNNILKTILYVLKKYHTRLKNIDKKLLECENMEQYRIYGELITANLYKIPNKNLDFVEVENYYDNNKIIKINLDKKYLPSKNAKLFFKKYSKLKNALEIVSVQKEQTIEEINYIESVIYELENCPSLNELFDIFDEISENDIFKEYFSKYNKKKSKIKKSKLTKNKTVSFNPIKYKVDGYTVLVGRNNKENDYLTLKYANKFDMWFHTKEIHGSHTILRIESPNETIPNDVLVKTAEIAAYHSKAKSSSNVPVDYCLVKYVKKPSGSKPGMVIYTNYKTLNVDPNH